ncbi:Para-nitrobenzyl esterase [Fusarium oxysporum f. sp. cubense]|uniref:Para-nitrobenzyl esterase n=1 Tax=Fusarium oxysporum f. sp. cubense TaxID=61366 RepID=A0A559L6B2_FUSOC|nr:Para-nitrobenzyl esterase [Fusarium oxysporum f. sp. cubense]
MGDPKKIKIKLRGGDIEAVHDGSIFKARGVRYASASRFQLPVVIEGWDGTLDYTQPASICSQMVPSRLDVVTGPVTTGRTQGEDCLHLTVTAPLKALTDGRKRPVMVFLHGGAYVSGGGDLDAYSPVGLAERDLVVVNVTYRLGLFGYMPIPQIAPVKLGFYDQIAALRWIQDNIVDLGGDSNNVTLFGESAGADSIFCLMIAERTQNLIHRAILQSASLGVRLMDRELMIQRLSELTYKRLTSSQAPSTSKGLLSLQTELTIAAKSYPSGAMAFGPSLGHAPIHLLSQVPHRIESPIRTYE